MEPTIYTPRAAPYHLGMRSPVLALLTIILAAAPAALAQPVDDAKPVAGWLAFMVMIGLLIVIAVGSFMSSRRGHQD